MTIEKDSGQFEGSSVVAEDRNFLFEEKLFAGSAVWACAVYSLVPFVGVVFVPFIFVFGIGSLIAGASLHRQTAFRAMCAGVLIAAFQLVLWWLLYAAPKWNVVN
ncbi:MAG: hypothetical protein ABL984_05180 [Pyrinomonadaceae bacterium]